ncbi:hypothetical protein VTK26DRAFT_921 [Humicola hyalothermophila]
MLATKTRCGGKGSEICHDAEREDVGWGYATLPLPCPRFGAPPKTGFRRGVFRGHENREAVPRQPSRPVICTFLNPMVPSPCGNNSIIMLTGTP